MSRRGRNEHTFRAFNYTNGSFLIPTDEDEMTLWLGTVFSNSTDRLLTCGGFPSAHCMYFVRERKRGRDVGRSGGQLHVPCDGRRVHDVADDRLR